MRRARFAISFVLAAIALGTSSCTSDPTPCSPDRACGAQGACVVGLCRAASAAVVPTETVRVVLLARDVAVLSSRDAARDARVTAFGSTSAGNVIVLLRFDADVSRAMNIEGAFLVIEPEAAAPGPTAPIGIDVAPILSSWDPASVSWGRAPTIGVALAHVAVPPARRVPLRVDVTRAVASSRGTGDGLALLADGDDPVGARLVTLQRSTNGPRLELYLRAPTPAEERETP